ncbi:MAG: hypothetical protein NTX22_04230 [Ignavibacteriales bacterium]|nr:hypothetical protein [Ignavibacteriales bacterium]
MHQKKIFTYSIVCFIFLTLLFNSIGYILIYQQQLYTFKHQAFSKIQNFLPLEKMSIIGLSKNDIVSGKISFRRMEEREFKLNGKMYDVVKEVSKKDSIYFFCIKDEKEDELHQAFVKYFNENSNQTGNKSTSKNIYHNIITEALVIQDKIQINDSGKIKYCVFGSGRFLSNHSETPSPPPKV